MRIMDCHQHPGEPADASRTLAVADTLDFERVCLVPTNAASNPGGFVVKALAPQRLYLFAGLDHSRLLAGYKEPSISCLRTSSAPLASSMNMRLSALIWRRASRCSTTSPGSRRASAGCR